MATVIDHASDREANDRCKALNRRGQPCRANTLDDSGFCFAHRTDMRELGRKGGKASQAARRGNTDKHASVYLRERVQESPELIWQAFKSAMESNDPRISSRGASLLLSYLPASDRESGDHVLAHRSELEEARERLALRLDALATRHILRALVERGLITPGVGDAKRFRPFVSFDMEELARWAAAWIPRPARSDAVVCAVCGKAGALLTLAEDPAPAGPVRCSACATEFEG